ncbi:hypothetical protein YC2023_021151 [Brassica napus]
MSCWPTTSPNAVNVIFRSKLGFTTTRYKHQGYILVNQIYFLHPYPVTASRNNQKLFTGFLQKFTRKILMIKNDGGHHTRPCSIKTSYSDSVKEAMGNAYVVKKCLELGYSTWLFKSNALLVDEVKEVVKGKGKIVKTVETMSIENRWEMANRPVVYWSHEVHAVVCIPDKRCETDHYCIDSKSNTSNGTRF